MLAMIAVIWYSRIKLREAARIEAEAASAAAAADVDSDSDNDEVR